MKTRNGFVSNSSSSSFVIVGLPASETGLTEEELNETGFEEADRNGERLIGISHYIGEWNTRSFPIDQFIKDAEKFQEKINKVPRVYIGMEAC